MSEEVKAPETKAEPTSDIDGEVIRNHKIFKNATAEIPKLRAEVEAFKNAEMERQRLIAEEKAKASGDLETFKAQEKARYDYEIAEARAEIRKSKIEALTAGIVDEDIREGVIAKMEKLGAEVDMNTWISEYKTTKPQLWQQQMFPLQSAQQQGGRPANSGVENWTKIIQDTKSNDFKVSGPAFSKIQRHLKEHGSYPEGYNPKG